MKYNNIIIIIISCRPKSKFARKLAQESLAIKMAVSGRSRVTSAAIADYKKQISMHEEQATNLTEDRQQQIYQRVEVEVFGVNLLQR